MLKKKSAFLLKDAAVNEGPEEVTAITHPVGNVCCAPDSTYSSWKGQ